MGSNSVSQLRPIPRTPGEWFARVHASDCTPGEKQAFQAWLRADPANARAYEECHSLVSVSGKLSLHHSLVDDLLAGAPGRAKSRKPSSPARAPLWPRMALAAAAGIALLVLGVSFHLLQPADPAPNTAATAKGQQRQIALADGTRIELNTDSTVSWNLTDAERRVNLKGEAFFDVAKDPRRTFIVHAGASEIRVVGTQFSVREHNGKVEVVVREGKVDVVPDPTARAAASAAAPKVELTPGKRLSYDNTQNLVRVASVDADQSLTWRSGKVIFDATTLQEALAEINRYATKPLVLEDEGLRQLRLSGRYQVGDIEAIEFALRTRFGIEAVHLQDRIVLNRGR